MPGIAPQIVDTGGKLAKTLDAPGSFGGRQLFFAECPYAVADYVGVAPAIAALQPTHDLARLLVESGMDYLVHAYSVACVYESSKLTLRGVCTVIDNF